MLALAGSLAILSCSQGARTSEDRAEDSVPAGAVVDAPKVEAETAPNPHDNGVAIVLDSGEDAVSLVDRKTFREISRFPVGKEPHHLMSTPDDRYLIVANAVSNDLVFLSPETGQIEKTVKNISDPYQLGFSPDKQWFVSVSLRLDRVDVYHADTFELAGRIPLGKAPSHLAFNHDSSIVFVTLQDSNELAAIDLATQKLMWRIKIGKTPAGVWMTPDDKLLLVGTSVMGEDYVQAIDWRTKKTLSKIVTGNGAHNFLPEGDATHVFVSNRVAGSVCRLNEKTLGNEGCFPVPGGPDCMELSSDGTELWVTSRWTKTVNVVDLRTQKIEHVIRVGRSPHGVYFHQHAGRV